MTRKRDAKGPQRARRTVNPIAAYATSLSKADAAICRALRAEIDGALPRATSRVWHGAPVWFVGDTPVVGYNSTARGGVNLLFWNGQAFTEPALEPVGKFKAAQLHFDHVAQIDSRALRRLLALAGTRIWDHSGIGTQRRST